MHRLPGALFDSPAERFDNVAHTIASRVTENGARFLPIGERRRWLITADQPSNVHLAPLAPPIISSERRLQRSQIDAFSCSSPLMRKKPLWTLKHFRNLPMTMSLSELCGHLVTWPKSWGHNVDINDIMTRQPSLGRAVGEERTQK